MVVDEHPHVVVAVELEGLAAVVFESRMKLSREAEIVGLSLFAGTGVAPAGVVEGVEKKALEGEETVALRSKIHVDQVGLIHVCRVPIPRIEIGLGRGLGIERASGRRARPTLLAHRCVDGLLRGIERGSHEIQGDVASVERAFKIRMAARFVPAFEIAQNAEKDIAACRIAARRAGVRAIAEWNAELIAAHFRWCEAGRQRSNNSRICAGVGETRRNHDRTRSAGSSRSAGSANSGGCAAAPNAARRRTPRSARIAKRRLLASAGEAPQYPGT